MVKIENELLDANLFSITVDFTYNTYIFKFLSSQKLPEHLETNERRKIEVKSAHYAIIANPLYRRGMI